MHTSNYSSTKRNTTSELVFFLETFVFDRIHQHVSTQSRSFGALFIAEGYIAFYILICIDAYIAEQSERIW